MFDPSSFLGAITVGVLGAALFWLFQRAISKIQHIDATKPLGIIVCVVIALIIVLLVAVIAASFMPHDVLAQYLRGLPEPLM